MTNMLSKRHSKGNSLFHRLATLIARSIGLREADVTERGSALLATLMIITGLTLLGLGFVAITQTESAISMNQKNYTQALQVAEAGANMVVNWFQNPTWALAQNIAPRNHNAYKVDRYQSTGNIQKYKNTVGVDVLFDTPFRTGGATNRFFGTENNPDIWINDTTASNAGAVLGVTPSRDFLTHFNISLFNNDPTLTRMDNNQGGIVTDIRIYAPPVENANVLTANDGWNGGGQPSNGLGTVGVGFIEGGTRFGVATIRVTATKFDPPCQNFPCNPPNFRVVATRTVKMTITEWPFPGPQGPVQTNANLNTSGNIQVHWGRTTASGTIDMAKTFSAIPWANAFELAHFEHGYDTSGNDNYQKGQATQNWPRVATAGAIDANNFLYELIGRNYPDPWWEMRARGLINGSGSTTLPIPFPYSWGNDPTINRSNWFQLQNQNSYDQQQNVLFPRIDYTFWKQLAQAADDEGNIYYLQWVAGETFRDKSGNIRDMRGWADTSNNPPAGTGPKSVPGFYFFDTQNQQNPQNNGGGTLTPGIALQGGSFQMKGFVYLNSTDWGTKGAGGVLEWVQMPGEPYRDIGYFKVEERPAEATYQGYALVNPAGAACVPPAIATTANCVFEGQANGRWDFQDLDWSNGAAAENQLFDFFVSDAVALNKAVGTVPAADRWKPVVWFPGCNPGVTCSEPHEPYLNLVYPTVASGGVAANWYNPTALNATLAGSARPTRRPKVTDNGDSVTGTPVACVAESGVALGSKAADRALCTSNAYDRDGGLVQLDLNLNGVLYNEGQFYATGNAAFFGSVLAEGNATKAGTPDIYFDERLVKGNWPPGNFGFPRVYVSSAQTDQ